MPPNNAAAILITVLIAIVALPNAAIAFPRPLQQQPQQSVRYPFGHPYYQEPHVRINSITDLDPRYARRAMSDVTTTISEVQKILATNPHLPRLTRGEIEELFENVTREEFEKSMRNGDRGRAKHMRALMVVLPYNTNNYSEDTLQELYTRPPVTRVVGDDTKAVRPQQIVVPPSANALSDNTIRAPTTYKPQPNPTTFRPVRQQLSTVFTKLPVYSKPAVATRTQSTAAAATTTPTAAAPDPVTISSTTAKPSTTVDRYNGQFSAQNVPFLPNPQAPQTSAVMRPNVKDLLATIGLTAEESPRPQLQQQRYPALSGTTSTGELTPEMRDLLNSFGLLTNEQVPFDFQFDAATLPPVVQQTSSVVPDFFGDLNDAQEEFMPIPSYNFNTDSTFGVPATVNDPIIVGDAFPSASSSLSPLSELLAPTLTTKHYRMHDAPEPLAGDYYAFKPLPEPQSNVPSGIQSGLVANAEMQEFLRSFGLLDGVNRDKKSIKAEQVSEPVLSTEPATTTTTTASSTSPKTTTTTTTTTTRSPLVRMEKIPAVQVDFLSPEMLNILGNLGIESDSNRAQPLSAVLATRRIDEIAPDNRDEYTIDVAEEVQPDPTKMMYPVFKPDSETAATDAASTPSPRPTIGDATSAASNPTKPVPVAERRLSTNQTNQRKRAVVVAASAKKPTTESHVMIVLPATSKTMEPSSVPSPNLSTAQTTPKPPTLDESISDYGKLQFLLATVKKLQQENGTLSDADLEQLNVNKLNLSETLMRYTKLLQSDAPTKTAEPDASLDPLAIFHHQQLAKNEVKRQSSSAEPTSITANTTTTTPASGNLATATSAAPFRLSLDLSGTTEATRQSNEPELDAEELTKATSSAKPAAAADDSLADASDDVTASSTSTSSTPKPVLLSKEVERPNGLEDSFPGGLDPVTEEPLPPPRRNGFYFFSDWNSFLEVGEDPDKVVVRFDPKIGDPSRFVPLP